MNKINKAILGFPIIQRKNLIKLKDELEKLNIRIDATLGKRGQKKLLEEILPESLHRDWKSYKDLDTWDEKFDKNLYDKIMGDFKVMSLPIVERDGPFLNGSINAEIRLMHDFTIAMDLFGKTSPDLVLFLKTPESGLEFCMYAIAKYFSIPTYFTRYSMFFHSRLFVSDIWNPILDKNWKPTSTTHSFEGDKNKLSELSRTVVDEIRNSDTQRIPSEIKQQGLNVSDKSEFKVKIANKLKIRYKDVRNYFTHESLFKRNIFKYNEKVSLSVEDIDWTKKSFYYPLHYQPEMSSMPSGKEFVNQMQVIKIIADNLKDNEQLLVKEHPTTFTDISGTNVKFRNKEFYNWIKSIPKVKLISVTASSIYLVKKSDAIITLKGTVGSEAMILKKPVIVFGNAPYLNGPGIFQYTDETDISSLLNSVRNMATFTDEDVDKFLLAMESCAYQINVKPNYIGEITDWILIEVLLKGLNKIYNK